MLITRKFLFKKTLALCLYILTNHTILSQNTIIEAQKINAKITVDGIVNEPIWETIKPLKVTQKVPNSGDAPTQKTEIRIAYDNEFIYLSGRMFDNEPEKINSNSKKRDEFTENTEWCGIIIDTYNDRENALSFFVTPTGSKLDMALSGDITGSNAFNTSWNTYWETAATITKLGWFAEIKIPFSSLAFEVKNGEVIMGITTWRYLARNDETDIYPPRDVSSGSSFRPSLTQRFSFKNIKKKTPIHITPYVLIGFEKLNEFNIDNQNYDANNNFKKEVGLDAKISLGSNTTLDLTVNTDFAQVEADNQQVNLTRSSIFFPEKRLFFQERAGLFNFDFGLSDKLFHSRRIGIVEGQQTHIYGGARLIGKFGKWELGGLTMQTGSKGEIDSENFTVFRVRKNIINENSTVGLITTNRTDFQGKYNSVYGIDANVRIIKDNYITLKWAQSYIDDQKENSDLNRSKLFAEISKRSQQGFTYTINYSKAGKDYVPGVGFETRRDFSQLNSNLSYNIFPKQESKISQYGPYSNSTLIWRNTDGSLESRNLILGFQMLTKLGWTYNIFSTVDKESLIYPFNFPENIEIAPGNYNFNSINASISSSAANKFAYSLTLGTGGFYEGNKTTINFAPFINITTDLSVQGNYQLNYLKFPNQNKSTTVQLGNVNILYTLNTKLNVSSLIQYNNVSQTITGGLRIRYNPKEGNDFYLVYNGDLNQNTNRVIPKLPVSNSQSILLKYSHTFHF
ncbi:DUF5916 domain-containing protein [Aureibaculum conchae]|uniref:DUF5916 domain-containing protein n=1 Tax=Aureibaculum sp. 2308TA14-22 TaxID=3108392 RepID=UPI003396C466